MFWLVRFTYNIFFVKLIRTGEGWSKEAGCLSGGVLQTTRAGEKPEYSDGRGHNQVRLLKFVVFKKENKSARWFGLIFISR